MGSYYYLYDRKCPWCNKENGEMIFATSFYDKDGNDREFDTCHCEYCEKEIRIDMEFVLNKYTGE